MNHASASASRPTLSREVHDSTIATASAASVTAPRLIARFSCAGAGAGALHARAIELDGERQQRDQDDADGHEAEVLFDERNGAREIPEQPEAPDPEDAAGDVEREKPRITHAADARDERGERPHDRHEPCE